MNAIIPISRLIKLPPTQRYRKILKVLRASELGLVRGNGNESSLSQEESGYIVSLGELLLEDGSFSDVQRQAIEAALLQLRAAQNPVGGINALRHILLAKSGKWASDWDFIDHQGLLNPQGRTVNPGMHVFLEDIRSPFNVGSMFRTAESFGIDTIYLSRLCADPLHPRSARTAMGCVQLMPWEYALLEELEEPIFALETGGTPMDQFQFPSQGIMIAGSEELGVSPEGLERADKSYGRVSIPTWGAKGSLNVSVAFGIVLNTWAKVLQGIT